MELNKWLRNRRWYQPPAPGWGCSAWSQTNRGKHLDESHKLLKRNGCIGAIGTIPVFPQFLPVSPLMGSTFNYFLLLYSAILTGMYIHLITREHSIDYLKPQFPNLHNGNYNSPSFIDL